MLEMLVHEEKSNEGIGYKVDSEAWYVIRNTNGVTGFVGVGSEPTPLEEKEVENLLKLMGLENEIASENREIRIELGYEVGDVATIVEGAFAGSHGKISEIRLEKRVESLNLGDRVFRIVVQRCTCFLPVRVSACHIVFCFLPNLFCLYPFVHIKPCLS